MTTFRKWYNLNQDKLQEDWDSFDGYPAGIER